ncbi:hypothetical protein EJB05_03433, partial [Eragrostis curvula]
MAERDRKQAEKACQRAEELFRAGNISGAHRQASKAQRLCPSLPGVANALAAYEIVSAAATAANSWRAVLGIRPGAAATPDVVKKQFRRLSLLVHPDKNRSCAAAEDAFKLLRQAFDDALLAAPSSGSADDTTGPCAAAAAARDGEAAARPAAARDDEPPRPPRATTPDEEPEPPWWTVPPRPWRVVRIVVYCPSCKNEFPGRVGPFEEKKGMRCARCPAWLRSPWQKKPPGKKEPPATEGRSVFPCLAQCPRCEAQFTSKVCVGRWFLRCTACSKRTMFDVQGPGMAASTA